MLDQWTRGKSTRQNPEVQEVPLISQPIETYNPGGAGNTAVNVSALGSTPYLIAITGKEYVQRFQEMFTDAGVNCTGVLFGEMPTILKQRILGPRQHIVRVDYNDNALRDHQYHEFIKENFQRNLDSSEAIIVSDYAKGTLSPEVIKQIISDSQKAGKPVLVDPRPEHTILYKNASVITPNFKEACEMLERPKIPQDLQTASQVAKELGGRLKSTIVLTMGREGIFVHTSKKQSKYFETYERQEADVSGAGDSVIAALSIGLANGLDIYEAAHFANHAGGVKVEKSGVQPVSLQEVIEDIGFHNSSA